MADVKYYYIIKRSYRQLGDAFPQKLSETHPFAICKGEESVRKYYADNDVTDIQHFEDIEEICGYGKHFKVAAYPKYDYWNILVAKPVYTFVGVDDTVLPKGKWISHYDELGYTCSVCGAFRMSAKTDNFKFCPDCGADLRGAEK